MAVIIGNARISEHGTVNGASGDQTGKEVMTQPWSSGGTWSYVIRPKSATVAAKIAANMRALCNNKNVGYSQPDRLSANTEAVKNGYKLDKLPKCNCDCSSGVALCCNAAGVKVSPSMYTGNELAVLKGTGKFTIYTASNYTKSDKLLHTGDILLRTGHTAIVTQGVDYKPAPAPAKDNTPTYKVGKSYILTARRNVHTGPGSVYPKKKRKQLSPDGQKHADITGALKKGTVVTCNESRKIANGNVWMKIPSGWICAYGKAKNKKYVK